MRSGSWVAMGISRESSSRIRRVALVRLTRGSAQTVVRTSQCWITMAVIRAYNSTSCRTGSSLRWSSKWL